MQHGTKNGYVGILFWLEPGAKITCNMVGFFWDRRSHSLLCRTIHALGLYRIHSSVKAKAWLGLGLELHPNPNPNRVVRVRVRVRTTRPA